MAKEYVPCENCIVRRKLNPDVCHCEETDKTGYHIMDYKIKSDATMIGEVGEGMAMCGRLWQTDR